MTLEEEMYQALQEMLLDWGSFRDYNGKKVESCLMAEEACARYEREELDTV